MANENQPSEELRRERLEHIVSSGKVKGPFVTVKQGTVLVATNLFTGRIVEKSPGLTVIWPWLRSPRISSTHSQALFTPPCTTLTSDNLTVSFDSDYMFKIIDQKTYEARVMATREGTSMSEEAIKTVGRILDQLVKDHIKAQNSDSFRNTTSISLDGLLTTTLSNGRTVEEDLEENFGIKITKMLIKDISLPKEITEAASKQKAAESRRNMEIRDAEAKATVTKTIADAEAYATTTLAEAKGNEIKQMIDSGLSPDAVAIKLANEALTNGTNPHTIVLAAAQAQNQIGAQFGNNSSFDMAVMIQLFNQMMQQNHDKPAVPPTSVPESSAPAEQQAATESTIDWASLSNDEYLSAEDSLTLAQERKVEIKPGARFHISLLTDAEKARYKVVAEKNRTR